MQEFSENRNKLHQQIGIRASKTAAAPRQLNDLKDHAQSTPKLRSDSGFTALIAALENSNLEQLEYILKQGIDIEARLLPTHNSHSPLESVVRALLDHGANIRAMFNGVAGVSTILDLACYRGSETIMKLLIAQIVKLETINGNVEERYHAVMKSHNYWTYYIECKEELEHIKRRKVHEDISLYDIFAGQYKLISRFADFSGTGSRKNI